MLFILVFLYLAGGAAWDVKTGKLPNRYLLLWLVILGGYEVLFGAAAGGSAGVSVIRNPADGVLRFLGFGGRILLATVFMFPLFYFHMMGAGDIKWAALLCGAIGLVSGALVIFYGLAAAAVWSFFCLVRKHLFLKRIKYFLNYMMNLPQMEEVIPYYRAERDGREAALSLAPFLFLGYLFWLFVRVRGGAIG